MSLVPKRLADAISSAHNELQHFTNLIENQPEKVNDQNVEKLVHVLHKEMLAVDKEIDKSWSAMPKKDIDDELSNRILNAIALIQGNANTNTRFANLGNVILTLWKALKKTKKNIKKFKKRIKVERVDDLGFTPNK